MRIVCSICLEDVHENSCLMAMSKCGHIFDKTCIDQALRNGRAQCPVCNIALQSGWEQYVLEPLYYRIFPSKSEEPDTKVCKELKKKLAEANQKISTLQSDLSKTKGSLKISRQQQNATSSQLKESKASLENATKSVDRLKKDIENLKRAKDECHKRNDKLKNSNQTLIGNLKISESLLQALREELASRDALPDSQGVMGDIALGTSDLQARQVSQEDYLDLKKSYQELVIRERLVEKKLTDLTLQQEGSNYTENLQHTQKIYKQLTDALSNEKKLTSIANQLKHEKKDIVNEKKSLQERFNVASRDLNRLQEAEKLWTTNTLHLQAIIKKGEQDISELQHLNQEWTAEISNLSEKVKSLNESLAASKNSYDRLKRSNEAAKDHLERNITVLKQANAKLEKTERSLTSEVVILQDKVNRLEYSKHTLDIENGRLLKTIKAARQPWFSFN